jgi:ribonuclease P protein component
VLPAPERLRANPLFKQVFHGGRSYAEPLVVLHILRLPDSPHVRETGFSVSKKVGNAVVRNRTRRRLREAVRALLPGLPTGFRAVVVARSKAAEAPFADLAEAVRRAYVRAGLLANDV